MRQMLVFLLLFVGCETQPKSKASASKVIAFTATWCHPCQKAKPVLAQIKAAGVEVSVIDIDAQPGVARQYGVTSVPTFFVYCGGKTVRTQDALVVLALIGG